MQRRLARAGAAEPAGPALLARLAPGRAGYMVNFCTGNVVVYDPAKDKVPDILKTVGWPGRYVGTIQVNGVVLDLNATGLN